MRGAAWIGLAAALSTPAGAAPVVAGITARRPASIHPDAERAFLEGAGEAAGSLPPLGPATRAQQQAAVKALEQGEAAYLEFKLKNAETALNQAVEGLLASPTELEDGEPAVRAALLLAQVLVARKQPDAADLVLERALLLLPGFPRGGQPPPDIQARIEQVRRRLADRLSASVQLEAARPTAVRLNGVPVGTTPLQIGRLAPGPLRVEAEVGGQRVARRVDLQPGAQTVQVDGSGGGVGGRLLAALAAGDEALARREARAVGAGGEVCAGLVVGNRAWLLRFQGADIRAEAGPLPGALPDWTRLGRRCAPGAEPGIPAEVSEIWEEVAVPGLADPVVPPAGDDDRWAYTALGGGGVALGVGIWLGLEAQDAADAYNRAGATADEDRARRSALLADVSYTVAVGLVATGIYLLLTD